MCGYGELVAALEFHHRDPKTKAFGLGNFSGSRERLLVEAEKCELVCANCHRLRHAEAAKGETDVGPKTKTFREMRARAVGFMGGCCYGCRRVGVAALMEFHHVDPSTKSFGISEDGIVRSWDKIEAELGKCVMLCANCHREVHAGMRELAVAPAGPT